MKARTNCIECGCRLDRADGGGGNLCNYCQEQAWDSGVRPWAAPGGKQPTTTDTEKIAALTTSLKMARAELTILASRLSEPYATAVGRALLSIKRTLADVEGKS